MTPYRYPLPEFALVDFCHPAAGHVFARACRHDGEILAGNGYVALRAARGWWVYDEFPPAGEEFLARFEALPWGRAPGGPWRALDDARGALYRRGALRLWDGARVAPSPVWRVGDCVVRLSALQLVARLPRAEIHTGLADRDDPLFFRFSGGRGIIARDPLLVLWDYHLWEPSHDCLSGERIPADNTPRPNFALPGWPPPECAD